MQSLFHVADQERSISTRARGGSVGRGPLLCLHTPATPSPPRQTFQLTEFGGAGGCISYCCSVSHLGKGQEDRFRPFPLQPELICHTLAELRPQPRKTQPPPPEEGGRFTHQLAPRVPGACGKADRDRGTLKGKGRARTGSATKPGEAPGLSCVPSLASPEKVG